MLRRVDGFDAVGCGQDYALGALRVLDRTKPREALKAALDAAAHFSAGVSRPFLFETEKGSDQ